MRETETTRTIITELTLTNMAGQQLRIGYVGGDIKLEIGAESFWVEAIEIDQLISAIMKIEEACD